MKFPPYGKQLMQDRMEGKHPPQGVHVVFDWNIGKHWPEMPRIVLPEGSDGLELRFLAGLDVTLWYIEQNAPEVLKTCYAILDVNPRALATFDLDNLKTFVVKNTYGEVMI